VVVGGFFCQQTGKIQMLGEYHDGNIFNKHNDQEKKTLVKRMFFISFYWSCNKVGHLF
jgi:hypothetical protein